jgi:hypothetical protein
LCLAADEPRTYNLEDIPATTIGGNGWTSKTPHTFVEMKGRDRIDCGDTKPKEDWFNRLRKIKEALQEYLDWLETERIKTDVKRLKYQEDWNNDAGNKSKQEADWKNYTDAQKSLENLKTAIEETKGRLKNIEKQRLNKDEDIRQRCSRCGPPKPCPQGQNCAGVCR